MGWQLFMHAAGIPQEALLEPPSPSMHSLSSTNTTVLQLRKGLLDSLAIWGTITGNDKTNRVKLDNFYKSTRDKFQKQPDSHPIVRVRAKIADFIYDDSPMLKNVNVFIERVVEYARSVGVTEGGGSNKIAAIVMTKDDNKCNFCDTSPYAILRACNPADQARGPDAAIEAFPHRDQGHDRGHLH